MPVYDEKYIKAEVKEFKGVVKNFWGEKVPKGVYHTCITCYENGQEELSKSIQKNASVK